MRLKGSKEASGALDPHPFDGGLSLRLPSEVANRGMCIPLITMYFLTPPLVLVINVVQLPSSVGPLDKNKAAGSRSSPPDLVGCIRELGAVRHSHAYALALRSRRGCGPTQTEWCLSCEMRCRSQHARCRSVRMHFSCKSIPCHTSVSIHLNATSSYCLMNATSSAGHSEQIRCPCLAPESNLAAAETVQIESKFGVRANQGHPARCHMAGQLCNLDECESSFFAIISFWL